MFTLKKDLLNPFLLSLKKKWEVYAPVKDDVITFRPLENPEKIDLSDNSYFPIKEHFFGKNEVLFHFNGSRIIPVKNRPRKKLFFGLRRCDLNSIKHQDMVFTEEQKDPYYTRKRRNSLLIGYHCNKSPNKYCFCESMELVDFYDLMFFDKGDHFLVDVQTDKGKDLVKSFRKYFSGTRTHISARDKRIKTRKLKKKNIGHLHTNPGWKKGVDLCFSCTACTEMCPSCYCHEIHDKVEPSMKGSRIRSWSSCQLKDFTKVAGDHVFREKKDQRFKHRIYHQIEYFKERYGVFLCTGCGRCISGCPTRIDWVKIINEMKG